MTTQLETSAQPVVLCFICRAPIVEPPGGFQACGACRTEAAERQRILDLHDLAVRILAAGVPPATLLDVATIAPKGRQRLVREKIDALLERSLPSPWLYVHSANPGLGKTVEAARAVMLALAKGYTARFITTAALHRLVCSSYTDPRSSASTVLEPYMRCEFLVLDDLGAEKATPAAVDTIAAVVHERNSSTAPTIYTSNFDLAQLVTHLAPTDEQVAARRIVDRIHHLATPIELRGESFRLQAAVPQRWSQLRDLLPRLSSSTGRLIAHAPLSDGMPTMPPKATELQRVAASFIPPDVASALFNEPRRVGAASGAAI